MPGKKISFETVGEMGSRRTIEAQVALLLVVLSLLTALMSGESVLRRRDACDRLPALTPAA